MSQIKVFGVPEAVRALEELPFRVRTKHMRIALNAGAGLIKNAAKPLVPVDSGLLQKSLAVKVVIPQASKNSDHWEKPAMALVGIKRRAGKFLRRSKRGTLRGYGNANKALRAARASAAGRAIDRERTAVRLVKTSHAGGIYRNPSRYAHLVEKGTKRMKARPFLAPAVAMAGTTAAAKIVAKLQQAIHIEAAQLANR